MRRSCRTWISGLLCACGPIVVLLGIPMSAIGAQKSTGLAGRAQKPTGLAGQVITAAEGIRGVCVLVGCGDGETILELARDSEFLIHALDPSDDVVASVRTKVDAAGLYGRRVVVEKGTAWRLPHASNTVDAVLVVSSVRAEHDAAMRSEAMRVLRPGGRAVLPRGKGASGHDRHVKPAMRGVDDWSHWEHGPDNNPVSTDQVIKAPYMTQWLGRPLYIAMPAITTAAGGRIFIAMGHIAHHPREERWLNTLMARNGHNGTPLWSRRLPDGYLSHRSAFIATDDVFYMIDADGKGCLMLDPESGQEKGRVRLPKHPGQWKWIAKVDDVLYALIGRKKDPAETTIVRSPHSHWSWGELSTGYYSRRVPWGFGETILAYDLTAKEVKWVHREKAPVDSRAMVIGGGRMYFYAPDAHTGCLDTAYGKVVWTNSDATIRKLIEMPGRGLGSTPGFKSTCFCLSIPDALIYEAQTRMNVVAVSKKDGRMLWQRKKTTNNPNPLYLDGVLYLGIGPNGSTLMVDPKTGKTIKDLKFGKRSCARLTATPDSLFCRGMPEGVTRYDRKTGKVEFDGAARPACNDGVIAANGLLYIGPWMCDCNLSLMGRWAMCSAGSYNFDRKATEADRLEVGDGDTAKIAEMVVTDKDWPTYRANISRSASTSVTVPKRVRRLWHLAGRLDTPTAPTAAAGMIFVCDGTGRVCAVDAARGEIKWTYLTAGPIIQPPTICDGRVYVGSGDGFVYTLAAATGRLLWRFRAAPDERRIMVYGSLCSTWPVNSGVTVADGIAYAAAGIIDRDGTHVYALDAKTGKIKWQNNASGHISKQLRKGVSAQGDLTIFNDHLCMPAGNVVPFGSYRLADGRYDGEGPGNGSPRCNRGEEIGVFKDRHLIMGGRLRYSARENVVNPAVFSAWSNVGKGRVVTICRGKITPAWNDDRIVLVDGCKSLPVCCTADEFERWMKVGRLPMLGKNRGRPKPIWTAGALGNGKDTVSLAIAGNAILAVCEVPVNRRIRTEHFVFALRSENGSVLWKQRLPGPALPGGLLVDRSGRIVVTLLDGGVVCYGR